MVEDTLKRLAREFTAKDIMVPVSELICGKDTSHAVQLLDEYTDFETIPICPEHAITHYVVRGGNNDVTPLNIHHDIIGDGTSILDLVQILMHRRFVFTMVGNRIGGYIHFSDLNHRLVELTFYLLAQSVENHLVRLIKSQVTEDNLPCLLEQRGTDIVREYRRLRARGANRDLLNMLYLRDIVKIATELGFVPPVTDPELEDMNTVRNAVSHAARLLVAEHTDVERLVRFQTLCQRLLGVSIQA